MVVLRIRSDMTQQKRAAARHPRGCRRGALTELSADAPAARISGGNARVVAPRGVTVRNAIRRRIARGPCRALTVVGNVLARSIALTADIDGTRDGVRTRGCSSMGALMRGKVAGFRPIAEES